MARGGADTGSLGMEVTQRGPGAEPLVEVRGNPLPKWASGLRSGVDYLTVDRV